MIPPHPRPTLLSIVLKATFIALVSFGGPAGALAALSPRTFFGLTAFVACPPDTKMEFEEWYDGTSNQVRMYCIDAAGGDVTDRTLLALAVWLGAFFLVCFYLALAVLLILRARNRKKYGDT